MKDTLAGEAQVFKVNKAVDTLNTVPKKRKFML